MRAYSTSPRPTVSPRKPPKRTEPGNAIRGVNQHVAHRLKTLRRTRFKTQTELGAAVGMTFQQMAKYERGISKIAPGMLWKLAEYFEVDIGYFFEGLDGTTPGPELHQTVQRRLRLAAPFAGPAHL